MTEAYCGIDVGTSGVRALVVDATGCVLGSGGVALAPGRRDGGRHEQDPADWWTALTAATRAAIDEAGPDVRVVALALDATSGTVLVVDQQGDARGPALMYDDDRATDLAAEADRAGRPVWERLGHRIQPTWALPKVLWLHRSGALGPGDRVVHQSDHLLARLAGGPVPTDTSSALKTGVDLEAVAWPDAVLADLGLATGLLPEVVLPGTPVGAVSADAARETGLPAGCEVRTGMTDGCASQVASGALRPGEWSSALGTTLVLKGSVEQLVLDPEGAVYCHRHPDGGWLPGGASSSGTGALVALLPHADLDDLARRAASSSDPVAAAYPLASRGERFPFVSLDAEHVAVAGSGDLDVYTSTCLGIAFVERLAYDVLGGLGADVTGSVALTGGATRSPWLNRLRTDVLGREVSLPGSAEAALGMAVLAAAPPGRLGVTAGAMVTVRERLHPDLDRGRALAPAYRRFVTDLVDRGWLGADRAAPALAATEAA
jgi:sugar (pentulose or hexulose) kinase